MSNELTTRYKFRKCVQRTGEQLDAFITRLNIILKECDYGDEKEKQLRDQIVFGCREDSLRDKFFREAALTQVPVDLREFELVNFGARYLAKRGFRQFDEYYFSIIYYINLLCTWVVKSF